MDGISKGLVVGCGTLVVSAGVIVGLAIVDGWVLSILWDWFVVSLFGLQSLSIPQAIGFSLVVGYLTHQTMPNQKNKDDKVDYVALASQLLKPFMALFIGWVVYTYFIIH